MGTRYRRKLHALTTPFSGRTQSTGMSACSHQHQPHLARDRVETSPQQWIVTHRDRFRPRFVDKRDFVRILFSLLSCRRHHTQDLPAISREFNNSTEENGVVLLNSSCLRWEKQYFASYTP